MPSTSASTNGEEKVKTVKLVDKSKRAFSTSIESSKAFELAIRKPRRKTKHQIVKIRSYIYGIYLLFFKHIGNPPDYRDSTWFLVAYSFVLTLDFMLLSNFFLHIILPITNFWKFGWTFCLVFFGLPFIAPFLAFYSALTGSIQGMKSLGNVNSYIILCNIPLTMLLSLIMNNHDTPSNLLMLTLMIAVKIGMSGISAKVC